MSLNALVRLPLSNCRTHEDGLVKHSLFSSRTTTQKAEQRQKHILVVQAKGKKGMQARQFQRSPPPSLPKIEDDGNPKLSSSSVWPTCVLFILIFRFLQYS